jgi:hypothetical protein
MLNLEPASRWEKILAAKLTKNRTTVAIRG